MSSEQVERAHRLQRTDPAGMARQLREQLEQGGVSAAVLNIEERVLLVVRSAQAQQQIDLREEEQIVAASLDPLDRAQENLTELNVRGLSLRGALFEAADAAAQEGGTVVAWVCGDPAAVAERLGRRAPRMQNQHLFLLQAPLRHSSRLDTADLVACVGPSLDDPSEVLGGILIHLEDTASEGARREDSPGPDRELSGSPAGGRPPREAGTAGSGGGRPLWAGPAPS